MWYISDLPHHQIFMNYTRLFVPNSIVFITIVTSKRRPILINNIELLKFAITNAHKYYNFVIYAICVMNDHLHFLIKPDDIKDYSKIILLIKRTFSKNFGINSIADYKSVGCGKSLIYRILPANTTDANYNEWVHDNYYKSE